MKAEKRHELQQNELADWLGEHIESAKPYAGTIAFVVIGTVVAIGLGIYLMNAGNPASAAGWSDYFSAFNDREPAVALNQLATERPGTPAALWALQSVGDINLSQGSLQLFSDREEAKRMLDKAEEAYKKVEADASADALLRSRARLGLAKLYEATNRPDEAKKFFELVAQEQKDTAIGKVAAQGVERLSDPRNVALLAWFAEQKPRKPAPFPGAGGIPGLPNDLPERPDLSLPGLGGTTGAGLDQPGTGLNLEGIGDGGAASPMPPKLEFPKPAERPAAPAGDDPAATAKPPSEDKPAADKPAADKPAETKPE
jgi:hypothetical protein